LRSGACRRCRNDFGRRRWRLRHFDRRLNRKLRWRYGLCRRFGFRGYGFRLRERYLDGRLNVRLGRQRPDEPREGNGAQQTCQQELPTHDQPPLYLLLSGRRRFGCRRCASCRRCRFRLGLAAGHRLHEQRDEVHRSLRDIKLCTRLHVGFARARHHGQK